MPEGTTNMTPEEIAEAVSARLRGEVVVKASYRHGSHWDESYMAVSCEWRSSSGEGAFRTNYSEPLIKRALLKGTLFSYEGVLWEITNYAAYDTHVMLYVKRLP